PSQRLGLPALSGGRLPNPNEWTLGARAYLDLAHEWPQYASQISTSRINDLIQIGTTFRQAVQNANSIRSGNVISGNQPLFAAVAQKYSSAVAALQGAIATEVNNFTKDPSKHLQGLNLWGGSKQSTSYVPAALSATIMPACNNGSKAYIVPSDLVSLMSPVPRLAEQLGIGNLNLCLSYSSTAAFTFSGNGPPPITLDTYTINGTINGVLVFSRKIYTYNGQFGGTSCGPDQIWSRFVAPCDGS